VSLALANLAPHRIGIEELRPRKNNNNCPALAEVAKPCRSASLPVTGPYLLARSWARIKRPRRGTPLCITRREADLCEAE
jgi:hypothetical protein